MNGLPLWPLVIPLVFCAAVYALGEWETRKFDRKYPEKAPRRD